MTGQDPSAESAVARTLLEAGLWAATGRRFFLASSESPPDSQRLLSLAIAEKMVPMLDAFARAQDWTVADAGSLTTVFRIIADAHYGQLDLLLESLAPAGIEVVLLKGGDLDRTVYPGELPRSMADLDLMVRPTDVESVEGALAEAGFAQGILERRDLRIQPIGRREKLEAEGGQSELLDFLKIVHLPELSAFRTEIRRYLGDSENHPLIVLDRDVFSVLAFDVHVNLSTGFDIQDSWRGLRSFTLPSGREVRGQSYADLLWFIAARLYHEVLLHSRPSMRYFVDVIALLARFSDRIDWERVLEMGRKYKLFPSLYFVLWHANEILGDAVPQRVIDSFDVSRAGVDRSHDWGDFVAKMLGEVAVQPLRA